MLRAKAADVLLRAAEDGTLEDGDLWSHDKWIFFCTIRFSLPAGCVDFFPFHG